MEKTYPLHEKLKAHEREARALGGFLDMLDEQGLTIGKYHEHTEDCNNACGLRTELYDFGVPSKTELIGLYLEIDPKEVESLGLQ